MEKFPLIKEFLEFLACLGRYFRYRLSGVVTFLEKVKSLIIDLEKQLYEGRITSHKAAIVLLDKYLGK